MTQFGPIGPPTQADLEGLKADLAAAAKLHMAGRIDEAEAVCRNILDREPGQPEALNLMGVIQSEKGRGEFAIHLLSKAALLRLNDPNILQSLGKAYLSSKRFDEAIDALEAAVALAPDSADSYSHLLLAHRLAGHVAEAEHLIGFLRGSGQGAVAIDFEHAQLLSDLGRKEEARQILQDLVRRHPGVGRAWYMLARLDAVAPGDPIVDEVLRIIETTPEPSGPMKFLCYAAGKIFDDLGEYDRAFGYFERAKRQEPQSYSPSAAKALFDAVRATFTEEFFGARSDFGVASNLPIFIVGMPRSGTTLAEQILASHPDVFGGGELEYLTHAMHRLRALVPNGHYPQNARRLRRETAAALAFSYLRKLRRLNSEKARITDKMPHNFMLLGLMRLMFVDLKAVHCVRHPFDTCLSLFMQDFVQSHGYNQSLSGLAHYYALYRELLEHWSSLFGERILELRYETLVTDQEEQSRRLLDFNGLSWSERVLDYARTPRRVSTPSSWQVRQRMFSSSIGRWTNYRKHVEAALSSIPARYLN